MLVFSFKNNLCCPQGERQVVRKKMLVFSLKTISAVHRVRRQVFLQTVLVFSFPNNLDCPQGKRQVLRHTMLYPYHSCEYHTTSQDRKFKRPCIQNIGSITIKYLVLSEILCDNKYLETFKYYHIFLFVTSQSNLLYRKSSLRKFYGCHHDLVDR